jgi:hypothetical protein
MRMEAVLTGEVRGTDMKVFSLFRELLKIYVHATY